MYKIYDSFSFHFQVRFKAIYLKKEAEALYIKTKETSVLSL